MKLFLKIIFIIMIITIISSIKITAKPSELKENKENENKNTSFLEITDQLNLEASTQLNAENKMQTKEKLEAKSEEALKIEALLGSDLKMLIESKLQNKSKLTLREMADSAVVEADKIVAQMKKEMEDYAKTKKNKPIAKKDISEENNEVDLINKYSNSKFLPEDVNRKLNEFRLE